VGCCHPRSKVYCPAEARPRARGACGVVWMCVCVNVRSHAPVHADKDGHAGGGMGTTPGSWA